MRENGIRIPALPSVTDTPLGKGLLGLFELSSDCTGNPYRAELPHPFAPQSGVEEAQPWVLGVCEGRHLRGPRRKAPGELGSEARTCGSAGPGEWQVITTRQ